MWSSQWQDRCTLHTYSSARVFQTCLHLPPVQDTLVQTTRDLTRRHRLQKGDQQTPRIYQANPFMHISSIWKAQLKVFFHQAFFWHYFSWSTFSDELTQPCRKPLPFYSGWEPSSCKPVHKLWLSYQLSSCPGNCRLFRVYTEYTCGISLASGQGRWALPILRGCRDRKFYAWVPAGLVYFRQTRFTPSLNYPVCLGRAKEEMEAPLPK